MTEHLASIFDSTSSTSDLRGHDIRVQVQVPSHALGDADGYFVELPRCIEQHGMSIERAILSPEDERGVRLFLPEKLPSPARLRLRGHGGRCEDGVPGDLWVDVEVLPSQALVPVPKTPLVMGAAATAFIAIIATLLAFLL